MRIAMLTNNYKPFLGGVPISVERQAQELRKRGHEVVVFAPDYGQEAECEEGVIRYQVKNASMKNGMVYPRLINRNIPEVFEREPFDCIHVHHPMFMGPLALRLGKKHDIPVIYTYHTRYEDYLHYVKVVERMGHMGTLGEKGFAFLQKTGVPLYLTWFANQCDLIFAPTASMREILRRTGTYKPVEVLPTGLAESFYERSGETEKIRKYYGRGCKHLLCSVSRLEAEKNPEFLLRGIACLKKQVGKTIRVLLIGEGSMREELEYQAEALDISDVVEFVGNVPNESVKGFLQASDLFLFASKSETQGIVLAEAMAAGCPIVAVEASGVNDIVKDGHNGYRTKEQEELWAGKVIEALGEDQLVSLQDGAERTAYAYRASNLAKYAETLYMQAIIAKEMEGRKHEEHIGSSVLQLFKTT